MAGQAALEDDAPPSVETYHVREVSIGSCYRKSSLHVWCAGMAGQAAHEEKRQVHEVARARQEQRAHDEDVDDVVHPLVDARPIARPVVEMEDEHVVNDHRVGRIGGRRTRQCCARVVEHVPDDPCVHKRVQNKVPSRCAPERPMERVQKTQKPDVERHHFIVALSSRGLLRMY